jgi:hypothetical protein
MHIVSWNHEKYESIKDAAKAPDGLAVLGVLFKISHRDNPIFEPLIHAIPNIRDPGNLFDKSIFFLDHFNVLELKCQDCINHLTIFKMLKQSDNRRTNLLKYLFFLKI